MITDKYMPLSKAAKILGVTTQTARKWFEIDCGLVFRPARFQRSLVSERDLQAVINKRVAKRGWSSHPGPDEDDKGGATDAPKK
jgi:hypothetical protein